jgi:hypothetical protein
MCQPIVNEWPGRNATASIHIVEKWGDPWVRETENAF